MDNLSRLQNIRTATKAFLDQQTSAETGLIESYNGSSRFSYDRVKGEFEQISGEYLQNQCFVYDGALASMSHTVLNDLGAAGRILEVFERNFHMTKGDRIGLFNAYRTDGYANESRLLTMGIDGDRMHAGPNIWVGLAAYHHAWKSGDSRFLPLCLEVVKWAMNRIPHHTLPDGRRAGIAMGSGWGPNWEEIYSTEHNLDYYAILAAVGSLFGRPEFEKPLNDSRLTLEQIESEKSLVLSWLKERVFDQEYGRFCMGFNAAGIDRVKALDTTTFAVLGVGPRSLEAIGISAESLINFAERQLSVSVAINGEPVRGFDFTDGAGHGHSRPSVIWIEGTFQMVLVYKEMAAYFREKSQEALATSYALKASDLADQAERLIKLLDSPSGVPPYTSARPRTKELMNTFKDEWEIQRSDEGRTVTSVASATWRLFASVGFNPMALDI